MKAIYIIILLTVLLGSCETLKNNSRSKIEIKTDSVVKNDIEISLNEKDLTELQTKMLNKEVSQDSSFLRIIVREFIQPDSSGTVVLKKETIYEKQSDVKRTSETKLSEDVKNNITKSVVKKDHSKTMFDRTEKYSNKAKSKPVVSWWIWLLIGAACSTVGLWLLKKNIKRLL
jgi:hypothetical protein